MHIWAKTVLLATTACALAAAKAPAPPPLPFDVTEASIAQLDAALAAQRVTSRQLVAAYLARIAAYDQAGPGLNAIVRLNPHALDQADALDRERQRKGPRGPLHGIPVLVKDNYATADMATSGGTLALATLQPSTDADQIARLRAAGAIILGKTAMHELAAGITTVSSLTGYTHNPYDPARSPGGSSAKGIIPLSHTQDIGGPLTRSVEDLAIMLDATVDARHPPYRAALQPGGLSGARIGVLRPLFGTAPDDKDGQAVVDRALAAMRAAGATLSDVTIPAMDDLLKDSSVIAFEFKYDLAAWLAAQPNAPVGSLSQVIALGMDHDALDTRLRQRDAAKTRDEAGYAKALEKRRQLHDAILRLMADRQLDAILYPTTLRVPPLIGAEDNSLSASCQLSAVSGLPAIAIPAGFTDRDLPVGIELIGAPFAEPALLRLAYGWEQVAHPRQPPFSTPPLAAGKAPPMLAFATAVRADRGTGAASLRFTYDPGTAALDITAEATGLAPDELIALTVQRSHDGGPGPVMALPLTAGQRTGHMVLMLSAHDRADLMAGRLYAALYTRAAPLGAARGAIRPTP